MEIALIRKHPESGYEMVKTIKLPHPVAEVVLQHRERLDGSGYPHGLKGHGILLEAQIVAIADVVEAISSCQPIQTGKRHRSSP